MYLVHLWLQGSWVKSSAMNHHMWYGVDCSVEVPERYQNALSIANRNTARPDRKSEIQDGDLALYSKCQLK